MCQESRFYLFLFFLYHTLTVNDIECQISLNYHACHYHHTLFPITITAKDISAQITCTSTLNLVYFDMMTDKTTPTDVPFSIFLRKRNEQSKITALRANTKFYHSLNNP